MRPAIKPQEKLFISLYSDSATSIEYPVLTGRPTNYQLWKLKSSVCEAAEKLLGIQFKVWTPFHPNGQHGCKNNIFDQPKAAFLTPTGCRQSKAATLLVFTMNISNNCSTYSTLKDYQHQMYAVVYSVILAPGLLGNVLALWVFRIYRRETKRGVVFMMNLAVADLLQVKSTPFSFPLIA
ncbi:hypothetical protein CHARACLAT_033075 [Characodon lateralis]|uniref:G-protein coupled receptors family 1 profile domain-containing protein n=1 Tax=Characodon lateralis TaxID=208331 RepID=A0ABU7DEP7_9TELE|nr:hypothetical protein [Characodon lateralis]